MVPAMFSLRCYGTAIVITSVTKNSKIIKYFIKVFKVPAVVCPVSMSRIIIVDWRALGFTVQEVMPQNFSSH